MKAAVVRAHGETPAYLDFEAPLATEGEQLIKVSAAALTHLSRGRASGDHYSAGGQYPFVAGVDGVGRLEDGSRAYFLLPRSPFGAFAQQTVVGAGQCIPLPDDLDDVTAAAIANPGMSSWAAFVDRAELQPGETVLVNGATGSAGRLAVQIARLLGAKKVIATGRNPQALESLGADATIVLGDALEESLRPVFAAKVDVVIDYLWGHSAESLLIAAAKSLPKSARLRFVQVGSATGGAVSLLSNVLRSAPIEIMGSGLGSVPGPRFLAAIAAVFAAAKPAGLRIPIRTLPLAEVGAAWTQTESEGRLVFTMGN